MRSRSRPWEQLVSVSPQMKLATEVVLLLVRSGGRGASIAELAASLGARVSHVGDAVLALARGGLVRGLGDPQERVYVSNGASAYTLADIADAVGDWLVVATCQEDRGPESPGLSQALMLVSQQVRAGLQSVSIGGLL